ncbi:hypothetical protein E2C01_004105 [Portunus trituberculatus]|uniref:Uncharacterized protein n=1 Tax=Portunus trituberculatus TaxID=210409 RepID=A0A5B7CNY9_PORTR|nr:hypothetical protein [Portunus trituberculatus]
MALVGKHAFGTELTFKFCGNTTSKQCGGALAWQQPGAGPVLVQRRAGQCQAAAAHPQDLRRPHKAVWWRGGWEAAGRPPGPSPSPLLRTPQSVYRLHIQRASSYLLIVPPGVVLCGGRGRHRPTCIVNPHPRAVWCGPSDWASTARFCSSSQSPSHTTSTSLGIAAASV